LALGNANSQLPIRAFIRTYPNSFGIYSDLGRPIMIRSATSTRKVAPHFAALMWLLTLLVLPIRAQTNLVAFQENDKWGFKSASGQVVIKPRFDMADDFLPEGIAAVTDDRGWAYINMKGKIIIRPFVFDNGPDYFREGLARFELHGKFGFFDKKGSVTIRPQFDFAMPFQDGRSAVCMACTKWSDGEHSLMSGGAWGYIDHSGAIVIPIQFEEASDFAKGTAQVTLKGQRMVIGTTGKVLK